MWQRGTVFYGTDLYDALGHTSVRTAGSQRPATGSQRAPASNAAACHAGAGRRVSCVGHDGGAHAAMTSCGAVGLLL